MTAMARMSFFSHWYQLLWTSSELSIKWVKEIIGLINVLPTTGGTLCTFNAAAQGTVKGSSETNVITSTLDYLQKKKLSRKPSSRKTLQAAPRNWKLPKSGGLEMGTLWRQQKYLSVRAVKRKRSKYVIRDINEWKHETNTTKKFRLETDIQQEDGRKLDEKAMPINRRYSNEAEASQCRRRNGRGWQCPQRTLVGYSLCEYHLSKGRLRSVNSKNKNAGRVIVNNKVGSCRFKELRLIDAS